MITILVIVGIITVVILLKMTTQKIIVSQQAKAQLQYLNEFIADGTQEPWLSSCTSKEELIEEGQLRLWQEARNLRHLLLKLKMSDFKIDSEDIRTLKCMVAVHKIVLAMVMAEEGDLDFSSPYLEEGECNDG